MKGRKINCVPVSRNCTVWTACVVRPASAWTPGAPYLALPLAALWVLSPAVAAWSSRPRRPHAEETLTEPERLRLRAVGLKTWRFFDTFVGPQDHHLPPDNFQEDPRPVVARRTSPTTMGLYLLSVSTARDLGWLGLLEAADRLGATLESMGKLERYRGHFFN